MNAGSLALNETSCLVFCYLVTEHLFPKGRKAAYHCSRQDYKEINTITDTMGFEGNRYTFCRHLQQRRAVATIKFTFSSLSMCYLFIYCLFDWLHNPFKSFLCDHYYKPHNSFSIQRHSKDNGWLCCFISFSYVAAYYLVYHIL